jgi:RNA polymerase sigma-70 factor (ECF subfamily)
MVRLNFNKELAEDLLMDVVLKAYENFAKFDPRKASFKTWIFTLAHNHLVNFWRDNQKKTTTSLEDMEEEGITAAITDFKNNAENDIESEKIQKILSLMKDSEREMITLRYLEDLDYKEIAKITNKKEGAVRTCLSRAMENFKKFHKKIYPDKKKL